MPKLSYATSFQVLCSKLPNSRGFTRECIPSVGPPKAIDFLVASNFVLYQRELADSAQSSSVSCAYKFGIIRALSDNLVLNEIYNEHKMTSTTTVRKSYGNRKINSSFPEDYFRLFKQKNNVPKKSEDVAKLFKYIDDNIIGKNNAFLGPFGRRKGNFLIVLLHVLLLSGFYFV